MTTYLIDDAVAGAASQEERRIKASADTRSQHESRREQQLTDIDQVLEDSFPASDPPSWTSSISRVASAPAPQLGNERLVRRIRAEFLEMPGLCLTKMQAQRLWSLEPATCEALLQSLTDARFLRRTERGLFVLRAPRRRSAGV